MQFCLTIGTEPFHLFNGTYQTFTVFFPRACEGTPSVKEEREREMHDIVSNLSIDDSDVYVV